uniref:alpha/beta hydrolase n=1 Tax=Shinella sp. PSBB067 TaxID=2715959 RepID=UPI00351C0770
MSGTKAVELAGLAARLGTACVRFDYSGHGASGGAFTDGTISRWLEEALAVIDHAVKTLGSRRLVLVGSSMGGWIALRAVAALAARRDIEVAGLVLIAPRAGLHLGADRAEPDGGRTHGPCRARPVRGTDALWPRTEHLYAEAHRGRTAEPRARRRHRDRLPGAYPARHGRPGRALCARRAPDGASFRRRRGADDDPRRRSPALAAAGHRQDPRGGGGLRPRAMRPAWPPEHILTIMQHRQF